MGKNLATVLAGEGVTVNTVSQTQNLGTQTDNRIDPSCNDWFYGHDPYPKVNVSLGPYQTSLWLY